MSSASRCNISASDQLDPWIEELDQAVIQEAARRPQAAGLKFRRGSAVAKVAIARKLAVRLYWKLREVAQPVSPARMQGSPATPVVGESLSAN